VRFVGRPGSINLSPFLVARRARISSLAPDIATATMISTPIPTTHPMTGTLRPLLGSTKRSLKMEPLRQSVTVHAKRSLSGHFALNCHASARKTTALRASQRPVVAHVARGVLPGCFVGVSSAPCISAGDDEEHDRPDDVSDSADDGDQIERVELQVVHSFEGVLDKRRDRRSQVYARLLLSPARVVQLRIVQQ
jgi:hypothetical protein